MSDKKHRHTLVLGASLNPSRYSNICINELVDNGFSVSAVGLKAGTVAGVEILTGQPHLDDIHTITLYLGPQNQALVYDYILSLNPERIIFNPGTWNPELAELANAQGIKSENKCTLMMIGGGTY